MAEYTLTRNECPVKSVFTLPCSEGATAKNEIAEDRFYTKTVSQAGGTVDLAWLSLIYFQSSATCLFARGVTEVTDLTVNPLFSIESGWILSNVGLGMVHGNAKESSNVHNICSRVYFGLARRGQAVCEGKDSCVEPAPVTARYTDVDNFGIDPGSTKNKL